MDSAQSWDFLFTKLSSQQIATEWIISKISTLRTLNAQYLQGLQSQWTHQPPRNSWVRKQDCGWEALQEPAAAPLSRTAVADPARVQLYCSHQRETQRKKVHGRVKLGFFYGVCAHSAHLNSTLLKDMMSVVLAPHIIYPSATSVLESSWLGLCLVEFRTTENSVTS